MSVFQYQNIQIVEHKHTQSIQESVKETLHVGDVQGLQKYTHKKNLWPDYIFMQARSIG